MNTNEIVLFEYNDIKLEVPVTPEQDTVWLNRTQMAELFDRDVKTIGKHIANARREELDGQVVVAKFATTTRHYLNIANLIKILLSKFSTEV